MAQKKSQPKIIAKEKKTLEVNPVELPDDFPSEFVEVIEKLPDEKSRQQVIQMVAAIRIHRGPLPPPEDLKAYEEVVPGAAREILDMAKSQQAHRQSTEFGVVEHSKSQENWTTFIGSLMIFSLIGCGVLAMYWEYLVVAGIIFGTTIASITIAWLTGKSRSSRSKK